jgi:hypothetical protein
MQGAARERRGDNERGRRGLEGASLGVGIAVTLVLCSLGCGQVTAERTDGSGAASGGHEAGIIDINLPPDAGRDGKGSGAAATTGAAGRTGADTTGAAGTAGFGGRSGAAGTTGIAGTSGVAGTTGAGGRSGAAGTTGAGGRSGAAGTTGAAGTSGAAGMGGSVCPPPGGCPDGVCNPLTQKCVACLLDSDCKKGKGNLCDLLTLTCVECLTDADCDGNKTCGTDGSCSN